MRPPSRRFFLRNAFLFLSGLCLVAPKRRRDSLYRPTFTNLTRRGFIFGYFKSIRKQQCLARDGANFLEANIFCRGRIQSPFSIARGREIYIYVYIRPRSIVLDRVRDEIAMKARRHERGIPMSRGEYDWRANTCTRNVFLTHNISLSEVIIVTLTAISL